MVAEGVLMDKSVYAIVIFADIRGFTKWSDSVSGNENCPDLIGRFYAILHKYFEECSTVKELGDGAMLIWETPTQDNGGLIDSIIGKIDKTAADFRAECLEVGRIAGIETDLSLGWGVTRGKIHKINDKDYLGSTINRASRLCGLARPFGIVLSKENFSPSDTDRFVNESYYVKGISEPIKCLVTPEISSQFVPRELVKESPEVHIAGVCYKKIGNETKFLIAKRSESRDLYPGLYECCGGQLKQNELFQNGVVRHYRSEMNITVEVEDFPPKLYTIENKHELINGLCFCCRFIEGDPHSIRHTDVKWLTIEEIRKMPPELFIHGLIEEIEYFANQIK